MIVLIILTTYFSYKFSMSTSTGNPEQDKQMEMTMKFMIVFISIASLSLPTALALYWIVSNGCVIAQNFILKSMKGKAETSRKKDDKVKEVRFTEHKRIEQKHAREDAKVSHSDKENVAVEKEQVINSQNKKNTKKKKKKHNKKGR